MDGRVEFPEAMIPTMRVHLTNLGCKLNQAEIERMARELTAAITSAGGRLHPLSLSLPRPLLPHARGPLARPPGAQRAGAEPRGAPAGDKA